MGELVPYNAGVWGEVPQIAAKLPNPPRHAPDRHPRSRYPQEVPSRCP
ncbi:MAG: hypothetical protein KME11_03235 [Timaviella obliquedivisa GSE-PSE-MK23-08B]|nr:hypothetical protein [Timaviella obliquedivisa GSE-PSE-MK23-08B]